MGGSQWNIEKERFFLILSRFNILYRFPGKPGKHVDGVFVLNHLIVNNYSLHVSGMVKTMKIIKTTMDRSIWYFCTYGRAFIFTPCVFITAGWVQITEI